jgi:uncharacterized repeat protein (TIGR03837 family)
MPVLPSQPIVQAGFSPLLPALRWDIFCRVIDNFGDVGFCWRLGRELAARGQRVRLWLDDPSALAWMAPGTQAAVHAASAGFRPMVPDGWQVDGVRVYAWNDAASELAFPGDVVVEAFGCDPHPAFVRRMAQAAQQDHVAQTRQAAVWLNLEHLSAEPYVERLHGLASPQASGAGQGLTKWFFYPGFSERTGGLLRESDLARRMQAFDAQAWLAQQGVEQRMQERRVCLFAYPSAPWQDLVAALAAAPAVLLVPPGPLQAALTQAVLPAAVRVHALPYLSQEHFDHLLWACDLNAVRGEDSLVRAIWAGKPLLWQLYPQQDQAHAAKLDAFCDRMRVDGMGDVDGVPGLRSALLHWNGLATGTLALPDPVAWQTAAGAWRSQLWTQHDLVSSLHSFVLSKGAAAG